MKTRAQIVLLVVLLALAGSASSDPGVSWNELDPPNFLLVADFSPDLGLEGLFLDDVTGEVYGVSLADFQNLGDLPDLVWDFEMELLSLDLDEDGYTEAVVLARQNLTPGFIAAYQHNGSTWTEMWRNDSGYDKAHTDLQMVKLDGVRRSSYLLATGRSMEILDPNTGLVVWSSQNSSQGPGNDWQLVTWTLANFDQDLNRTEELLVEFVEPFSMQRQLLMIDEAVTAAATPLRSTIISLGPSRPNPMFGATTVQFELPETGPVQLNIYDVRGRRVATLADRSMGAGSHKLRWDGNDRDGARVAQGVYFYELKAAGQQRTRKMIVVR